MSWTRLQAILSVQHRITATFPATGWKRDACPQGNSRAAGLAPDLSRARDPDACLPGSCEETHGSHNSVLTVCGSCRRSRSGPRRNIRISIRGDMDGLPVGGLSRLDERPRHRHRPGAARCPYWKPTNPAVPGVRRRGLRGTGFTAGCCSMLLVRLDQRRIHVQCRRRRWLMHLHEAQQRLVYSPQAPEFHPSSLE